jgi:thioredoxin reductase
LLATSIVDESPDVPGLDEAVAKGSIRYCPVCDGYEAADQRIGILGHGEDASSKARFLRTYSNDVTLLSLDERGSENTETAGSRHKDRWTGACHRARRGRHAGGAAKR